MLHKLYIDVEREFKKESEKLKIAKEERAKAKKADDDWSNSLTDLTQRQGSKS